MFQPSHPLRPQPPFANIIAHSNMHTDIADPAWDLGMASEAALNDLRSYLRMIHANAASITATACQPWLDEVMRRLIALLALSNDDDKAALSGGDRNAEDAIGLTIAHQLTRLFHLTDDTHFVVNMLTGQDIADYAYRADLQIAALIHSHYVEQEKCNS